MLSIVFKSIRGGVLSMVFAASLEPPPLHAKFSNGVRVRVSNGVTEMGLGLLGKWG